MTIREALGQIAALPYIGNKAGSIRSVKDFETTVANILRNVGEVVERPNGNNSPPALTINGLDVYIKTSKGKKPMWNETILEPESLFIFNGSFGTVVTHSSFVISKDGYEKLQQLKREVPQKVRTWPTGIENWEIAGARIQFKDTIDWAGTRIELLNKTIELLEQ